MPRRGAAPDYIGRRTRRQAIQHSLISTQDVATLGQVFTPEWVVTAMISMRQNRGRVLEPSAGEGAFMRFLEQTAVGIEIDERYGWDGRVQRGDFFAYDTRHKFETIIGNPPYVRFQDINPLTKQLLDTEHFDYRSNLYLFFIWKSIDHLTEGGELIFITPRDFLKATSASVLNQRLYEQGSFSHFEELGDKRVFGEFAPNCAIWRWVKGRRDRYIDGGGVFRYQNGQAWFGPTSDGILGDDFEVKVGAVSGADRVFANDLRGCTEFVCSKTRQTSETRLMIYNRYDTVLEPYKQDLMERRIRKFGEHNWWEWGRQFPEREGERIYVNSKTRCKDPFFVSEVQAFDGSILALFPRRDFDLEQAVKHLNDAPWESLGFICDGRYMFTQRSLEGAAVTL